MPRLYCSEHLAEFSRQMASDAQICQEHGETVLIVSGKLRTGPWRCDRCNKTVAVRQPAGIVSYFPDWFRAKEFSYNFAYEREYFAILKATVTQYGMRWDAIERGLEELRDGTTDR